VGSRHSPRLSVPDIRSRHLPDDEAENLKRLADALTMLKATEWEPHSEEVVAREWSPKVLSGDRTWLLVTRAGRLDIMFTPSGTRGFGDLSRRAVTYSLGDIDVRVAALEDTIRSKEASARDRDLQQLPTLRKLLERRGRNKVGSEP
jgi:hypothetical protein